MADNNSARLLAAFVCLILGAVLINVVATQALVNTEPTQVLLTGPNIPRWGADNNVYTNATGRTYFNASTGSSMASSIYASTNVGYGSCTGIDTDHTYMYNGTTAAPGSYMGKTGGNFTITCSTTAGSTYLTFANNSDTVGNIGNNTVFYLSYYPYSYLEQGWNRTILLLVPGFFALALMGCALALFYGVAKDTGVIG